MTRDGSAEAGSAADEAPESLASEVAPQLEIRVITGGVPTAEQEAALALAVSRVIAQRDLARAVPQPIWGVVGRLEARDGRLIRSRAMLPRDSAWSPVSDGSD